MVGLDAKEKQNKYKQITICCVLTKVKALENFRKSGDNKNDVCNACGPLLGQKKFYGHA